MTTFDAMASPFDFAGECPASQAEYRLEANRTGTPIEEPAQFIEVFLQPGNFYFGESNTRIRTLLGSCISITVWHPRLLIGGMCHYMLPTRSQDCGMSLDGRYGDESLELFLEEIRAAKTRPAEYQVKLFGGSNMFNAAEKSHCPEINCADPINSACKDIACRNRRSARVLVERHGFTVKAAKLGGTQPYNLLFDVWSGNVWLRRPPRSYSCRDNFCHA